MYFFRLSGAVYHVGSKGTWCPAERLEIKSAKKCQEAAISLGLTWGTSWEGEGDFPACFLAMDHRKVVYFNESPHPKRDPHDIYGSYAPICEGNISQLCLLPWYVILKCYITVKILLHFP